MLNNNKFTENNQQQSGSVLPLKSKLSIAKACHGLVLMGSFSKVSFGCFPGMWNKGDILIDEIQYLD